MLGKTEWKVWFMFLPVKRQYQMSIRRLWSLETNKQSNFHVFLGHYSTRKLRPESHLEVTLQNLKQNRHI